MHKRLRFRRIAESTQDDSGVMTLSDYLGGSGQSSVRNGEAGRPFRP